jgi:hypothetical protein
MGSLRSGWAAAVHAEYSLVYAAPWIIVPIAGRPRFKRCYLLVAERIAERRSELSVLWSANAPTE